ncbi:HofO family protein [Raoultella terrigena]|uniref:HofO family protein n=1 Tax=Raoultella terrigena TaxID=577 RepID=UPI0038517293
MRALIERGMASLFLLRGGWLTLAVALPLTLAGGLWLISPPPAQESVRSDRLRQQWLKLLPLRVALAREEVAGPAERVFSPLHLPVDGAALIAWKPAGRGGEMVLELRWPSVPALFSWLADCGMRVAAFSLQPQKRVLRLSLQLEAEDAE